MRTIFLFLATFCLLSPSFAQRSKEQKVVSGTIMINDKSPLDAKALVAVLKSTWKLPIDSFDSADKTIVFNLSGATIMIAQLNYPADPIEIRAAAQLSWLWRNATDEALKHQSQVVISVIGTADKSLELHQMFTKVAASVLEKTASSGVYMSSQYLLLSKGFYVAAAHNMLENQAIPIYCWVYFGMPGDGGGYTFGMQEFGLPEMEIVQSTHSSAEVHAALYDAASSVLKYNTRLTTGESVVTEEGEKIPVTLTKGAFLEGQQVVKLGF